MKTIIAVIVATVGFTTFAAAQQPPFLVGNYSANVLQEYNGNDGNRVQHENRPATILPAPRLDLRSTGSIRSERTIPGNYSANVGDHDLRR